VTILVVVRPIPAPASRRPLDALLAGLLVLLVVLLVIVVLVRRRRRVADPLATVGGS
jgi:hypothetical protein